MIAHDPTEAVLMWALGMGIVMIGWAIAEKLADRWRVRQWARRLRDFDSQADHTKYALRHHAGLLPGESRVIHRLPAGMPVPARELQAQVHEHTWTSPAIPNPAEYSVVDWDWIITGQECKCGAKRKYHGPAFGWKSFEEPRVMTAKGGG